MDVMISISKEATEFTSAAHRAAMAGLAWGYSPDFVAAVHPEVS